MDEPENLQLLTRARAGDAEAFCELVRPCWNRLYQQALGLGNRPADADDLVAETAEEAWRCLGRFRGQARLTTWLFGILWHRHLKLRRRERRWRFWSELAPVASTTPGIRPDDCSPADTLATGDDAVRMRALIRQLPELQQAVIALRFFEDASLAEIAAVLACPEGTVKSRLHHALAKLRALWLNPSRLAGDSSVEANENRPVQP